MNKSIKKTIFFYEKSEKLNMNKIFKKIIFLVMIYGLNACALNNKESDFIYVTASAYGHYGKGVGIPYFKVNGNFIQNVPGWGGGGGITCCVKVPKKPREPYYIDVTWETCDTRHMKFINNRLADKNQECKSEIHEQKVLVNFAVPPGESGGMVFHFLPGHKVEAWVSRYKPGSQYYLGPKAPVGKAPVYSPEDY